MLEFGATAALNASAAYLRMTVFVIEQKIPLTSEFLATENFQKKYFVDYRDELPVACLCYEEENGWLHPDRLCVLENYRENNIGSTLLTAAEDRAVKAGLARAFLHGEMTAQGFYGKCGYTLVGETFFEDGILCARFEKNLLA